MAKYVLSVFFLLMVACGDNSVQTQLESAKTANQHSDSYLEYKNSDRHPEKIFASLRQEYLVPAAKDSNLKTQDRENICKALQQLKHDDLTLFEEEIKKIENQELIIDCKEHLLQRLNFYYQQENIQLKNTLLFNSSDLKSTEVADKKIFPENIQYRDTSKGYKVITGDVQKKQVVLTFDDGPSPDYTPRIIKSLNAMNAKAIFFMLGKSANAHPALAKQVAEDGHGVGSHTMTHPCLPKKWACRRQNGRALNYSQAVSEIVQGENAILKAVGWIHPFFRFPYGESSPELSQYLRQRGIAEFFWNIDSNDWRSQSLSSLLNSTIQQIKNQGRGVVLFHDTHRKTAEVMPVFLQQLYDLGYQPVLLLPESTRPSL